jgi:hypothetical protein
MTQAEVITLLPIITPFAVPAAISTLYEIAYARFVQDAPACVGYPSENVAITYYIASLLASGADDFRVISEKIDDYSVNYGDSGKRGAYLDKYQAEIDNCVYHLALAGMLAGVERDDALECLNLDTVDICGEDTTEEFI